MNKTLATAVDDATQAQGSALQDVAEPDANFLLAAEREVHVRPPRKSLAVLVTDHINEVGVNIPRLVAESLSAAGFDVDAVVAVRSKKSQIRNAIETAVVGGVDLVVTIGGTGVGPRDKTPEATRSVLDILVPGIAQAIRQTGRHSGAIDACVSRGIAGVSGSTLVVNLAASPEAIQDGIATMQPLAHFVIDDLQDSGV
ncbi:MogA/MoaB family molybdenum cofactor biosynthesis protein [Corynebacterium uberis]|uniref:MogA/MoaB family molybdenum cofactor biosynthesis protein n=1 Tax=Corynebacterium TaxID=1716 RepID=UPI001D09F529|nr:MULTISPECIES: molybdopterin-binding protein [Corynebacterium]MCZ9308774.1 molybdopterin-binding protein [Corynebacterium sp. c6VSa_13]UDL72697.1 molybdenum cofactor biosynthesis protein [Corynebacterium uberis]UDL76427.1 molybdenum cofactor biosynthesis protein [Corynebacterium uberis]UDL78639.1 molybdenum cofactor biosynthesis protein [Corynebacterium uberis]UDL80918.1 molybdenum cofactor biosynthesis protein [Corynebacterium uberis]